MHIVVHSEPVIVKGKTINLELHIPERTLDNIDRYVTPDDYDHNPPDVAEDENAVRSILGSEGVDWKDVFDRIVRKKNQTFAKGRNLTLYRLYGQHYHDEDAYGWRGSELRITTVADDRAEVEFFSAVEQYDGDRTGILQSKFMSYKPVYEV